MLLTSVNLSFSVFFLNNLNKSFLKLLHYLLSVLKKAFSLSLFFKVIKIKIIKIIKLELII